MKISKLVGESIAELLLMFVAVYAVIYVQKYAPIDNLSKYPLLILMFITILIVLIFRIKLNDNK
ncbi:MAG: hypothetical protein WC781_00310 [Candidatus Pacearchaeota archaeon]|jgi:hypothetical protein